MAAKTTASKKKQKKNRWKEIRLKPGHGNDVQRGPWKQHPSKELEIRLPGGFHLWKIEYQGADTGRQIKKASQPPHEFKNGQTTERKIRGVQLTDETLWHCPDDKRTSAPALCRMSRSDSLAVTEVSRWTRENEGAVAFVKDTRVDVWKIKRWEKRKKEEAGMDGL